MKRIFFTFIGTSLKNIINAMYFEIFIEIDDNFVKFWNFIKKTSTLDNVFQSYTFGELNKG